MVKNTSKNQKNEPGVTLVSLVITIIVLLILAGITILSLTGDNGIFSKTNKAKEETNEKTATEIINLKITNAQIKSYSEEQQMPNLQYLADRLYEDNEIQYVYNESQKAAAKEKIIVNGEYIYTKLEEYPYEFKIDNNLRLASIDGIEIANNTNKEDYNALLNRVQDLENALNTQINNQPTGLKSNTYIKNVINSSNPFNTITSKTGFTKTPDSENNIANYLSYSTESGYTVLKEGWYFFRLQAEVSLPSSSADCSGSLVVGDVQILGLYTWENPERSNTNQDSCTLYLKEGENFYFSAYAAGASGGTRSVIGFCYPMF